LRFCAPRALPCHEHPGRQGNWPRIGDARAVAQGALDTLRATLAAARSDALAALLVYVVDFVVRDTQDRGREGKLVFDDLILRVRELLRDRLTARHLVRERFDCLLIDEFQDTDPLQVEVAWAFASDPDTGRLEPGRLFLVGDPKQSIYRFRRADMAVYSATRARVEAADGRLPELTLNRRSRPEVVHWVNDVFANVIGGGDSPEFQPPYGPIEASRDAALKGRA
jgi:ATP-dependent helicase/nuclease subunit A